MCHLSAVHEEGPNTEALQKPCASTSRITSRMEPARTVKRLSPAAEASTGSRTRATVCCHISALLTSVIYGATKWQTA